MPPDGFFPSNEVDPKTGKQKGWMPVTNNPEDKYHLEAFGDGSFPDGTYELCGPSIQGNPEKFDKHVLIAHYDAEKILDFPRDFEGIKNALKDMDIEGVVWHRACGDMVKIKKKDFFKVGEIV